jgi:S1-C subfamily serine protease
MTWDGPTLVNLGDALADLYPMQDESRRVVNGAGLRASQFKFNDAANINWFNILNRAVYQQVSGVDGVVAIVEFALKEFPANEILKLAKRSHSVPAVKGADIQKDVIWQGPASGQGLEKILGPVSALVDVSFLELGTMRARAVGRVRLASGGAGSGFLVQGGVLVTNHHVLRDAAEARAAVLELNYQRTLDGTDAPIDPYRFDPDRFFATSEADDWSAVAVSSDPAKKWGCLEIGEVDIATGARVNIVQHPGGGPKQIAFFHNTVMFVGGGRVQYLTHTLPGSSGSPVLDERWRVVALHHSGGWLSEPGADPKALVYRNEGIHIASVVRGMRAAGWNQGGGLS